MIKLDESQYPALTGRVDEIPINTLFARAVLTGDAEGAVYADRAGDPSAFYIVHGYGMSLLAGDSENSAFREGLRAHFMGAPKTEWLQAWPESWEPFLAETAGAGLTRPHTRFNFEFSEARFESAARGFPMEEYEVSPTPDVLLADMAGSVVPKDFWKPETLSKCAAFTAWVDGKPAATAFTAYLQQGFLEFGIETGEAFRRKGYARAAGTALVRHCLERALTPAWSCRGDNTGSVKLAACLGFARSLEWPYHQIPGGNV